MGVPTAEGIATDGPPHLELVLLEHGQRLLPRHLDALKGLLLLDGLQGVRGAGGPTMTEETWCIFTLDKGLPAWRPFPLDSAHHSAGHQGCLDSQATLRPRAPTCCMRLVITAFSTSFSVRSPR